MRDKFHGIKKDVEQMFNIFVLKIKRYVTPTEKKTHDE